MSIKTPSDYEFVVENLTDLVCTHSGSVDLQAELDWDTLFLPTILFQSIEGRLVDVCRDTYGNYVIQKMLPLLSDNQICSFVNIIQRGFISIAITIPGSCVLDCLIAECESRKLEMALLPIFNANLAVLSQLQHGSHVLQTLIDKFDVELLTEVFRFVKRNFLSIATDRYGCCLIKKIVEKDSKAIIPQVLANLNNLCTNQYGNYIIQHYFDLKLSEECSLITSQLTENWMILATDKFGSNVIEKIIESGHGGCCFLSGLLESDANVMSLALSRFGVFVLQTFLECSDVNEREELLGRIKLVVPFINKSSIKLRLDQMLEEVESLFM